MPTQHIQPQSEDHLKEVANALLKARKVVVITGAGISTNSGIPDFRSENGLYSLIQAQFDAAARQARQAEIEAEAEDESENDASDEPPACKPRQTSSPQDSIEVAVGDHGDVKEEEEEKEEVADTIYVQSALPASIAEEPNEARPDDGEGEKINQPCYTTPKSKPARMSAALIPTSPLSSPPAEEFTLPPSNFRPHTHMRLVDAPLPRSSSPLSSPPPILFDPFIPSSPSEASSDGQSSTSPSELEDSSSSNLFASSQASSSGKTTLPNMKGKDLFDANIWSDPIRTSVFYTFATSLRQKIKEAEPTSSHRFISHLRDRGKLVRCYTQNIDQIEEKVGLSTSLQHGPGSRARFSRRSTANAAQLNKMVDEAAAVSTESSGSGTPSQPEGSASNESNRHSQEATQSDGTSTPATDGDTPSTDAAKAPGRLPKREASQSGVECVFLHGSLELLRCFLCGRLCSWEDDERETETLAGQQPECPHCVGATAAREEKGKRALGIGKLRPDIVLYGEEHPNSHLISPIVTHDLALYPDMLLILGTSLRVHGLKVMVREFAKAVHSKNGKVVFVNFTKPPESSWGDVIDYWVQWDCDAWVADLRTKIPKLWQDPEPPRPKKKRESSGTSEDKVKEEKKRPPAANPVALRDTKATGAYWTTKVLQELRRITGRTPPARRASISAGESHGAEVPLDNLQKSGKPKPKRPRMSAPGALEKPKRTPSTLNPNHGRSKKPAAGVAQGTQTLSCAEPMESRTAISSILNSVKENPRIRKRKVIDGEEVPAPGVGRKRGGTPSYKSPAPELKLAPMQSPSMQPSTSPYGKPQPLEPQSPPSGPLSRLSPNLRVARVFDAANAPCIQDTMRLRLLDSGPTWSPQWTGLEDRLPLHHGTKNVDASAAAALASLRTSPTLMRAASPQPPSRANLEGQLMSWGSNWSCNR